MLREMAPPKNIKTFFGPFRIVFDPFWTVFWAVLAHVRAVLHDVHIISLCFFSVAALRRRCSAIVASARHRRGAAASARRHLPQILPFSSRTVKNGGQHGRGHRVATLPLNDRTSRRPTAIHLWGDYPHKPAVGLNVYSCLRLREFPRSGCWMVIGHSSDGHRTGRRPFQANRRPIFPRAGNLGGGSPMATKGPDKGRQLFQPTTVPFFPEVGGLGGGSPPAS